MISADQFSSWLYDWAPTARHCPRVWGPTLEAGPRLPLEHHTTTLRESEQLKETPTADLGQNLGNGTSPLARAVDQEFGA
jgi:hypothetical protein